MLFVPSNFCKNRSTGILYNSSNGKEQRQLCNGGRQHNDRGTVTPASALHRVVRIGQSPYNSRELLERARIAHRRCQCSFMSIFDSLVTVTVPPPTPWRAQAWAVHRHHWHHHGTALLIASHNFVHAVNLPVKVVRNSLARRSFPLHL